MVVGMFISMWFLFFVYIFFITHTIDYLFLIRLTVWKLMRVTVTRVRLRMKAALAWGHVIKTVGTSATTVASEERRVFRTKGMLATIVVLEVKYALSIKE